MCGRWSRRCRGEPSPQDEQLQYEFVIALRTAVLEGYTAIVQATKNGAWCARPQVHNTAGRARLMWAKAQSIQSMAWFTPTDMSLQAFLPAMLELIRAVADGSETEASMVKGALGLLGYAAAPPRMPPRLPFKRSGNEIDPWLHLGTAI